MEMHHTVNLPRKVRKQGIPAHIAIAQWREDKLRAQQEAAHAARFPMSMSSIKLNPVLVWRVQRLIVVSVTVSVLLLVVAVNHLAPVAPVLGAIVLLGMAYVLGRCIRRRRTA